MRNIHGRNWPLPHHITINLWQKDILYPLFWCSLKRPSVKLTKLLVGCLNVPWKSFYVNLALERLAFVAFWKLTAVTLLLHADWMMVKNASNERGANSVTALRTRNPSRGCILENYLAVSTWILNESFDWMPGEEASTFQFIWCSIWKPGDSNVWVKICLVLGSQKRAFHPWLLLITCSIKESTQNPSNRSDSSFCNEQTV